MSKQFLKIFLNGATQIGCFAPRLQSVHAHGKIVGRFGSIDFPYTLMQVMEFATAVANFQKAVQKTQQKKNSRKELGKGTASCLPAVIARKPFSPGQSR